MNAPAKIAEAPEAAANDEAAVVAPSINEAAAKEMATTIGTIVGIKGEDCPALIAAAKDHSPEELQMLLNSVGHKVDATDEAIGPWLATVDEAKRLARDAVSGGAKGSSKGKSSKGGKAKAAKPKGEKKAKAEKKPVEIKPVETVAVDPSTLELPEKAARAAKVPMPKAFFLEAGPRLEKGSPHQVDPSRPQGCAPVMPNIEVHAKTGNPYPLVDDDTVVTTDKYKGWVAISHATFSHLAQLGELKGHPAQDVTEAILTQAGVKNTFEARLAIQDTLRDLALYGFATQSMQGRTRIFTIRT